MATLITTALTVIYIFFLAAFVALWLADKAVSDSEANIEPLGSSLWDRAVKKIKYIIQKEKGR